MFNELKIHAHKIKNRICMPPMITCHANDGMVNDFHMTHYGIRSDMGVGMIIVEATSVTENGRITIEDLGIWKDEQIYGFSLMTDYLRKNKTVSVLQLAHAGRKVHSSLESVAPSAIPFNDESVVPSELSTEEINGLIKSFADAARRAKEAGFDAVEIHAAHGYLINQFLSPLTNKRTDEFGGSFDKRFEFLKQVYVAVRKEFCKLVFVRVSADEHAKGGLNIDDHIEIAKKLEELGVDLLDISSGGVVPTEYKPFPGYQVHLSEAIKKNVSIPVSAVGLITEYKQVKDILTDNKADIVQLGRELLRNPGVVIQFAKTEEVEIELPFPYSRI